MTNIAAWASRALFTAAIPAVAISTGAGLASAHVHVQADDAQRGGLTVLTFRVPNESSTGALTTQLSVALPNVTSATTESMPGWTARLDRDAAAGVVRSATWTAAPGGGVAPDQFALFRVDVKLPDTDSVSFPTTQTYSDGTAVHWDQPSPPGGSEPEHPAPTLTLTAAGRDHDDHQAGAPSRAADDTTARWLAAAGIAVGLIGVALALIGRRRA